MLGDFKENVLIRDATLDCEKSCSKDLDYPLLVNTSLDIGIL